MARRPVSVAGRVRRDAMACAHFRFYEELNDFLPPERRKVEFAHAFDRRASIKDMIEALGVPHPEVELVIVNGESVGFEHIVRDGDRIAVYPVFESLDVSSEVRVRDRPLRTIRFVLDVNLGALARYLRFCGFDSRYHNGIDDEGVARISAEQRRILLTRDRDVLKRRIVTHGYFVRAVDPPDQLSEVFRRFDLYDLAQPFTRCARCNGRLHDVDKAAIVDRLEPLTRKYFDEFRQCDDCGRIYWRGSHVAGIERLIARIRAQGAADGDGAEVQSG